MNKLYETVSNLYHELDNGLMPLKGVIDLELNEYEGFCKKYEILKNNVNKIDNFRKELNNYELNAQIIKKNKLIDSCLNDLKNIKLEYDNIKNNIKDSDNNIIILKTFNKLDDILLNGFEYNPHFKSFDEIKNDIKNSYNFKVNLFFINHSKTNVFVSNSINRAILNLCGNSVKAMKETNMENKGKIIINFYEFNYANIHVISVEDNGPGIPPEIANKLYKEKITTQINNSIHGRGSMIVKKIAKDHGGDVELRFTSPGRTIIDLIIPKPLNYPSSNLNSIIQT